jgi:polar amino acid transport system substrate-binding protein
MISSQNMMLKIVLFTLFFAALLPAAFAETLHDRVIRTGKMRVAYAVYYPLLMRDPNTKKFSGIGYDALLLVAQRLGLKLEMTEEVSCGTMIEGLQTNRYDVMGCPVWANATRARAADFSRPLCFSQICAFTKFGDKRIDSSLKGLVEGKYKLATLDGEIVELIAKSDFPKAKRLSLPQLAPFSDLLLSVSTGKADATFAEPVFGYDFIKHNPKSIQNITPNNPLRVFPNVFMFKVGEPEFKAMINTALDEIANSGELENIIEKYEPYPKAYLRCAAPYQK